jgi:hypothetical protein
MVVRQHKRHSICLYVNHSLSSALTGLTSWRAIHTYQNQATTARHARPRDHVVIYSGDRQPNLVAGEDNLILRRPAIKVRLDPKGEGLEPASRLNLAKFYTVEHNIAIFPVGKISAGDVDYVRKYGTEVQGFLATMDAPSQSLGAVDEQDEEDNDEDDEEDDDG